ncbi:hypothetical protein J2W17_002448 [Pseudomonas lini]|nr:hypothetical protein [Pseudomonas lini]
MDTLSTALKQKPSRCPMPTAKTSPRYSIASAPLDCYNAGSTPRETRYSPKPPQHL